MTSLESTAEHGAYEYAGRMNIWAGQRKRRFGSIGILVAVMVFLAPGESLADCSESDLVGSWEFYSLWSKGRHKNGTTDCTVSVLSGGEVNVATDCSINPATDVDRLRMIQGGALSIRKNCKVWGLW